MINKQAEDAKAKLSTKRCTQCFQDLPKMSYSKRQFHSFSGKCISCVTKLDFSTRRSNATYVGSKWAYVCYYRVCFRGKNGKCGVGVRQKCSTGSVLVGHIAPGRVFQATDLIYSDQGDALVRIADISAVANDLKVNKEERSEDGTVKKIYTAGYVPWRSVRNEVYLERHRGPFQENAFYQCVVEGCKVRTECSLDASDVGFLLYGDIVHITEGYLCADGLYFLRLHHRYFDCVTWVLERSLDNESVMRKVDSPQVFTEPQHYRCVLENGAPVRTEPSLDSPPVSRLSCGAVVSVTERYLNADRQIFLRLGTSKNLEKPEVDGKSAVSEFGNMWVIEYTICCASVMQKIRRVVNEEEFN